MSVEPIGDKSPLRTIFAASSSSVLTSQQHSLLKKRCAKLISPYHHLQRYLYLLTRVVDVSVSIDSSSSALDRTFMMLDISLSVPSPLFSHRLQLPPRAALPALALPVSARFLQLSQSVFLQLVLNGELAPLNVEEHIVSSLICSKCSSLRRLHLANISSITQLHLVGYHSLLTFRELIADCASQVNRASSLLSSTHCSFRVERVQLDRDTPSLTRCLVFAHSHIGAGRLLAAQRPRLHLVRAIENAPSRLSMASIQLCSQVSTNR